MCVTCIHSPFQYFIKDTSVRLRAAGIWVNVAEAAAFLGAGGERGGE